MQSRCCGCELIVMGTHGRLRRAVMGSVAEEVSRKALCPIATIRPSVAIPQQATPILVGGADDPNLDLGAGD